MFRSSPADPFVEAIRTAPEIGAEVVFVDPDSGDRPHLPDAYPDPYSIKHIGMEKYVEAYRVYPQERTDEIAPTPRASPGSCKGPIRWRRCSWWCSLNLLDPLLDAMEMPQDPPSRRRPPRNLGCSIRIRIAWPRSRSNIPYLQDVTRSSAWR